MNHTVNKNVFGGFVPPRIVGEITKNTKLLIILALLVVATGMLYYMAKSTNDVLMTEDTPYTALYNAADIRIKLSPEASVVPIVRFVPMNKQISIGINAIETTPGFEFGSGGYNPSPVLGFSTAPRAWWERMDVITSGGGGGQKIILIFV